MTKSDISKCMILLKTAYPQFYSFTDKDEKLIAINLWYISFKDYEVDRLQRLIMDWVNKSNKPPTIADLKSRNKTKFANYDQGNIDYDKLGEIAMQKRLVDYTSGLENEYGSNN